MTDLVHVVCVQCDSTNRVPSDRPAEKARCGLCKTALFPDKPSRLSAEKLKKQIEGNDLPVLVDFWAEWCGPCLQMAPVFEAAVRKVGPRMRFAKIDTEAEPEIASEYRIQGIPTLILFKKGKVAARVSGAMDLGSLLSWIDKNL